MVCPWCDVHVLACAAGTSHAECPFSKPLFPTKRTPWRLAPLARAWTPHLDPDFIIFYPGNIFILFDENLLFFLTNRSRI